VHHLPSRKVRTVLSSRSCRSNPVVCSKYTCGAMRLWVTFTKYLNHSSQTKRVNTPSDMKSAYLRLRTSFPRSLGIAQLLHRTVDHIDQKWLAPSHSRSPPRPSSTHTRCITVTEHRLAWCPRLDVDQSVSGSVRLSAAVQRRGSHCMCYSQLREPATSRLHLLCNYATIPRWNSRMLRGTMTLTSIRTDL
jgi:hypothetical protein